MSKIENRKTLIKRIVHLWHAMKPLKYIADHVGLTPSRVSVLARRNGCLPRHGGAKHGKNLYAYYNKYQYRVDLKRRNSRRRLDGKSRIVP